MRNSTFPVRRTVEWPACPRNSPIPWILGSVPKDPFHYPPASHPAARPLTPIWTNLHCSGAGQPVRRTGEWLFHLCNCLLPTLGPLLPPPPNCHAPVSNLGGLPLLRSRPHQSGAHMCTRCGSWYSEEQVQTNQARKTNSQTQAETSCWTRDNTGHQNHG